MNALMVTLFGMLALSAAAEECPAVVEEARTKVAAAEAALKRPPRSAASARSQDVQAPRAQDVQAPRSQDVQAPRSQDVQAPRAQDVQAPRAQDVQAPRGQEIQAPKIRGARTLVRQAEQACKAGDFKRAEAKANEALARLK